MADVYEQAMVYYQLMQQGVPPAQAFKQAFPDGLPNSAANREKAQKKQASDSQKAGAAQLGGVLVGALGTRAAYDAATGKPILGIGGSEPAPKGGDGPPVHTGRDAAAQGAQTGGATTEQSAVVSDLVSSGQVQALPPGSDIPEGYEQIGQNVDGSPIVGTSEAVNQASESGISMEKAGEYFGYAVAAYQGYNTWKNRKDLTDKEEAIGYTQAGITAANSYYGGNPYLSAAGTALNVYQTYDNDNLTSEQQAARAQQQIGAGVIDYWFPGMGSAIDAGLQRTSFGKKMTEFDAKYNPMTQAIASFGSSKGKEQMARDKVRDRLEEIGIINKGEGKEDNSIHFGDGSAFDIGKDGGARLTNSAGERRQYSDVDFSDKFSGSVVGAVNPLAAILTGGNERLRSDTAGWYTNAVLNGAPDETTMNVRIKELYGQHGITQEQANQAIDELVKKERIDEATAAAYRNGLNDVFNGMPTLTEAPAPEGDNMIRSNQLVQALAVNKPVGQPGVQGQQLMGAMGTDPNMPTKQPTGQVPQGMQNTGYITGRDGPGYVTPAMQPRFQAAMQGATANPQWMPPEKQGQVDPQFNSQGMRDAGYLTGRDGQATFNLPQNQLASTFGGPGYKAPPVPVQPRQISSADQQRMNQMMQQAQQQGRRLTPQEQWRLNQIRGHA